MGTLILSYTAKLEYLARDLLSCFHDYLNIYAILMIAVLLLILLVRTMLAAGRSFMTKGDDSVVKTQKRWACRLKCTVDTEITR